MDLVEAVAEVAVVVVAAGVDRAGWAEHRQPGRITLATKDYSGR